MIRFFIKPTEIGSKIVNFTPEQSKKIRKVLRMKVGDKVSVFDGNGWEYNVSLTKITNSFSLGEVVDKKLHENHSKITLVQALPKNLKTEFILQKCTELGVDRFVFFESEFSQVDSVRLSKEKVQRWRSITVAACEQSGRLFVPEVNIWSDELEMLIENLKSEKNSLLYLDREGETVNKLERESLFSPAIFVGPEGGFSKKEKDLFSANEFTPIKVSHNILRSETAGMAFLSQIGILI
jgi:16S rRNA (uracil1498-N3)-methyltransferase